MRTFKEVSESPIAGDFLRMRGGYVIYRALEVAIAWHDGRPSGKVYALRTETRRDGSLVDHHESFTPMAWRDLVQHGASSVGHVVA